MCCPLLLSCEVLVVVSSPVMAESAVGLFICTFTYDFLPWSRASLLSVELSDKAVLPASPSPWRGSDRLSAYPGAMVLFGGADSAGCGGRRLARLRPA